MWIRRALARRPGSERGQASVEYLGLITLVGAIVVALLAAGIGTVVSDSFAHEVDCLVTFDGGGSCAGDGKGGGGDAGTGGTGGAKAVDAAGPPGDAPFTLKNLATEGLDGPDALAGLSNKRNIPPALRPGTLTPRNTTPKILCKRGYMPVPALGRCFADPNAPELSDTERYEAAAALAEAASELTGHIITPDEFLFNDELLEALVNGVGKDKDGNPIAKRGLLAIAPFAASLGPEALLGLAALAGAMLIWQAINISSGNRPVADPPHATHSPMETGLTWTSPAAVQATEPPQHQPGDEVPQPQQDTPRDPMHALDDVPRYTPGLPAVRRDWARRVEEVARRNPLTRDFRAEDALALADYTGSWYSDINNTLRGQPPTGQRGQQVNDRIAAVDRALLHLPSVPNATVYRGAFLPQEILDRYANGEEVAQPDYLSTSNDPAVAARRSDASNANGRQGENVLLEIDTDYARNVDPLSRYRGVESEMLIPRGGTFKQTGTEERTINGKKYKVIKLKQTDG